MSLIIKDQEGSWVALFPAAIDPKNEYKIVSHPGSTFSGLFFNEYIRSESLSRILDCVIAKYRELGFKELVIRPVPTHYRQVPIEDDYYAIYKAGSSVEFCRPSCAISLTDWGRLKSTKGRKSSLNKALRSGLSIDRGIENLSKFWDILVTSLERDYGARPTHSIDEILDLFSRFPDKIELVSAIHDGKIVAGVLLFKDGRVCHTQYIASTIEGRNFAALDLIIHHTVKLAKDERRAFFDFGTSQITNTEIDETLYFFKQSFGALSFCHWAF
jgi:hypothetical protein